MSKSFGSKQSSQRIVRELFRLSDEEDVLDDFSCALKKKVNIHGRLFCTDNFLCFYANILGFKTKLVIALREVTNVVKSPKEDRAIEVTWNGKTYMFRSFYRSNDALKFIHTLWRNTGAPGAEEIESWSDDEENIEEEKEDAFIIPPDQNANAFETVKVALPVSPQQFFDLFYADNAPFSFQLYYTERGDTEIDLAPWVANEEMGGFTRDVKFRTKVNGPPIGAKTTRCEIAQQYQLQPSKLQVKYSCRALDVPFSACFLVEQEWTVYSITPDRSVLRISAAVTFVKSTMFRSIIENRSKPDIAEDHRKWLQEMKEKKAFPDVPVQAIPEPKKEEQHHNVAKYPEVDPHLLAKPKNIEGIISHEKLTHVAVANAVGLVFLALYVLFLHLQLTDRMAVQCG